jgi:hypothetical protein
MKGSRAMLATLKWTNVALRALMEVGIVVALGYWGYQAGKSTSTKLVLSIGAPVLGFGTWGAIDFRQAGTLAEPLRLFEELVISGLAAIAWYVAGQHALGWALAILSLAHHSLVYLLGGTLLKQ